MFRATRKSVKRLPFLGPCMPVKRATDFDSAGHFGIPRTVPTWIRVITDPELIEAHRESVNQSDQVRLDALMTRLGIDEFPFMFLDIEVIFRLREQAVSRLEVLMVTDYVTPREIDSAMLLLVLQQSSGLEAGARILRSTLPDLRCRFLRGLRYANEDDLGVFSSRLFRRFLTSHTAFREGLLQQLDEVNSDVREEAIWLCGDWKVRGYELKFREILSSGSQCVRELILRKLTDFDLSESLFNIALELPETVAVQFGKWDLIRRFLKSPDPTIGIRAYAWLKRYADDAFQSDATGFDGGRCELIRSICNYSQPDDLAWLTERLSEK